METAGIAKLSQADIDLIASQGREATHCVIVTKGKDWMRRVFGGTLANCEMVLGALIATGYDISYYDESPEFRPIG